MPVFLSVFMQGVGWRGKGGGYLIIITDHRVDF